MLYVECYADEAVARALGVASRSIRHVHGKGNIENRLRLLDVGTGLMDEDTPSFQPRDYRRTDNVGNLILLTHATATGKRIILIRPRLEEWLVARATAHDLKLSDFGLPDSPDRLHSIPRYDRKPKFPDFLQRLKQVDPEVQRLGKWIAT
jgi:hypothetical protein